MPRTIESKLRARLPFIRFMQSYMPLSASGWLLKQGMKHVRLDAAVRRESIEADGVRCEWIIPQNSSPGEVLLYLHGGGFVYGLSPPHLQMGAYLAQKMGLRMLVVDYRVAPADPFPAALDDCVSAYCWLLNQGFLPKNMVIAGDSAGGNLTITTLMKLRDSGFPLPAAAACLSPVADLTEKVRKDIGIKDPLLPARVMRFYRESFVGNNDARNPLISPVFGDLSGLPPLLVHVGEDEVLCEDAVQITSLAKAAGVDARLEIYPRMWHVWQLNLELPQAVQSLEDIAQFLRSHLETVVPQSSTG